MEASLRDPTRGAFILKPSLEPLSIVLSANWPGCNSENGQHKTEYFQLGRRAAIQYFKGWKLSR